VNGESLLSDISGCPTPAHLTKLWRERLVEKGFRESTSSDERFPRAGFLRRSGLLVAWRNMDSFHRLGARVLGAHSDSPGLHLKPNPNRSSPLHGLLAVEVYGSPILSSWFDRDLGVAGIVIDRNAAERTFHIDRPIARLPHLAIHLDRDLNDRGHVVDRHRHLNPVWSVTADDFLKLVGETVGLEPADIESMSCQLVDTQSGSRLGNRNEFLSSPRLDNQVSCWAAMNALTSADTSMPSVAVLFDHEEVGSSSVDGAAGPLIEHLFESLIYEQGRTRIDFLRAIENTSLLSMDNSHGVHPNHPEKHDLDNAPTLGGGVAVKNNVNQRYATSIRSLPGVLEAARNAGVNLQKFSSRNDVGCGSTIGPIAATRLGIETVDVGVPQWSMHSIREMCHASDVEDLAKLAVAYLTR